jgi:CBS domain-containing protein
LRRRKVLALTRSNRFLQVLEVLCGDEALLNPALKIEYFEELFRAIKERFPVHVHGLSPVEIIYLAKISHLSERECLLRLRPPAFKVFDVLAALRIGQEKKIGSFPVVDKGKLVGIATESDIIRFLTGALGIREEGSRITIEGLGGKLTELEKIVSIASQHQTIVLSMISLPRPEKKDWMIVLRLKTSNPDPIVKDFKKAGFNVTYSAWLRCEAGNA